MSILSWLVTVWNIGGIILLVVFKIVYSLLLLFQLQFYSQKTGAVKHNRQDRKNRGKGRQTLLLRSHGLITIWLISPHETMNGSLIVWLFDIMVRIMGILPTLYSSLFVCYAICRVKVHSYSVLHQRLLDPPLKDKTKVPPLLTPSLPHPAPTIKSEFVICIAL